MEDVAAREGVGIVSMAVKLVLPLLAVFCTLSLMPQGQRLVLVGQSVTEAPNTIVHAAGALACSSCGPVLCSGSGAHLYSSPADQ
jgi:hypothetical protein